MKQPSRTIDVEHKFKSANLDLQEGLGSESTELTSSALESTRGGGVHESTSTEHSLTGEHSREGKAPKKG